jgi:hypothetical protein
VTILILEHACLFYASSSMPTFENAFDDAYSQYQAADIHNKVIKQFSGPSKEYSIQQFTEFILSHRY